MLIWIVWSDKPLAVFSSEARARAHISRNDAETRWGCSPMHINAEDFSSLHSAHGRTYPRATWPESLNNSNQGAAL